MLSHPLPDNVTAVGSVCNCCMKSPDFLVRNDSSRIARWHRTRSLLAMSLRRHNSSFRLAVCLSLGSVVLVLALLLLNLNIIRITGRLAL